MLSFMIASVALWGFTKTSVLVYKTRVRNYLSPETVKTIDGVKARLSGLVDLSKSQVSRVINKIPGYTRTRKYVEDSQTKVYSFFAAKPQTPAGEQAEAIVPEELRAKGEDRNSALSLDHVEQQE